MSYVPYVGALKSLMYEMVDTRSKVAQPISVVGMYMGNHRNGHWFP